MKKCIICGKDFEPAHYSTVACSISCRKARKRQCDIRRYLERKAEAIGAEKPERIKTVLPPPDHSKDETVRIMLIKPPPVFPEFINKLEKIMDAKKIYGEQRRHFSYLVEEIGKYGLLIRPDEAVEI